MDIGWSAWDGILALVVAIVLVWAALKLMARFILALVVVVLVGVVFFGMHWGDFVGREPASVAQSE